MYPSWDLISFTTVDFTVIKISSRYEVSRYGTKNSRTRAKNDSFTLCAL